jgi:hypothetical protein
MMKAEFLRLRDSVVDSVTGTRVSNPAPRSASHVTHASLPVCTPPPPPPPPQNPIPPPIL